jgi:hypothetical protein
VETVTGVTLNAEQVYNFHWSWIVRRGGEDLSLEGFEVAQTVLKGVDVCLSTREIPLSQTTYPVMLYLITFAQPELTWRPEYYRFR